MLLETTVLIATYIVAFMGGVAVGWLVDFLKSLWTHYPDIKERINEFLNYTKKEVHVFIDKIDNRRYQLKVRGKEKREILISHRVIPIDEMKKMSYQGGDHFEQTLMMEQIT